MSFKVIEQTKEEKIKMYMKTPKKELVEMFMNTNMALECALILLQNMPMKKKRKLLRRATK